jgi:predicted RNase H-like nuclease (RuvC/YqgF family)
MSDKCYGKRNPLKLDEKGGYFIRHMAALTRENLHGKAEIAEELGYRDMIIDELQAKITELQKQVDELRGKLGKANRKLDEISLLSE